MPSRRAPWTSAGGVQCSTLTGAGKAFEVGDTGTGAPYVVRPYADRMELAYSVADLVVARRRQHGLRADRRRPAGDLCALPIGNGEQELNAADVVAAGGGLLVPDASVNPEWVAETVIPLLRDSDRLRAMARGAASVGQAGGDRLLAGLVAQAYATRSMKR